MWIIVSHDSRKDSFVIEITRIIFEKKNVNTYNNYTCEHDEHLLYQNKKKKVKIMWMIVTRDSRKDGLVIEITRIIIENKKLISTIITLKNMMSPGCIKIKKK